VHAVVHWRAALTPYLPDNTVSWLIVHKLELPSYVMERSAIDSFVTAAGISGWCCTVGVAQFGDYSVGGKRGKKSFGDVARRSLAAKQLSVPEAVERVVDSVLLQLDSTVSSATNCSDALGSRSAVRCNSCSPEVSSTYCERHPSAGAISGARYSTNMTLKLHGDLAYAVYMLRLSPGRDPRSMH
jgi:hypothetical protein